MKPFIKHDERTDGWTHGRTHRRTSGRREIKTGYDTRGESAFIYMVFNVTLYLLMVYCNAHKYKLLKYNGKYLTLKLQYVEEKLQL